MLFKWYLNGICMPLLLTQLERGSSCTFYHSTILFFKGICSWANTEALPFRASLLGGIPGMLLELSAPWRNPEWIQQDEPGQKAGPRGTCLSLIPQSGISAWHLHVPQ